MAFTWFACVSYSEDMSGRSLIAGYSILVRRETDSEVESL